MQNHFDNQAIQGNQTTRYASTKGLSKLESLKEGFANDPRTVDTHTTNSALNIRKGS